MRASGNRVLVLAATAVAATFFASAPASAAAQPAAPHSTSLKAAGYSYWGHFSSLDKCLATGDAGHDAGHWRNWYCDYPSGGGHNLWVEYY